jgi:chitodextrinase
MQGFFLAERRGFTRSGVLVGYGRPDEAGAVSAATKSTAVAACTAAIIASVAFAGAAGAKADRDTVPPTVPVDLHVKSATASGVLVEWTPSQDDVAVTGYYVYRDRARAEVEESSYLFTSLRCGESGPIRVEAHDAAGNRSKRAEAIISAAPCSDTTPPTAPSGFQQAVTTRDSVILSWKPSVDASGVVGYGVYEGVTPTQSTAEPKATLSGLRCGSTYRYGVDAVDGAGNRSPVASVFVTTAACGDTESPSAPTAVAVTARTSTSIALSWSASGDNVAVVGYEVLVNGSVATKVTTTNATLSGLACATSYAVGVRALDAAGNRSSSAALTTSTAACSPSTPPGDTTAPSAPSNVVVTSSTRTSITLSWSASTDNVAVAGYGAYLNDQLVASATQTGFTFSGLACGTAYSVAIDAYDQAGNRSAKTAVTASTAACSDMQAPSAPANLVVTLRTTTSIALSWAASTDNVGVTGYGLYRAGAPVGTSTQTAAVFSGLTCNTSHTLSVDAYDAAGNRSSKTNTLVSTTACPDTTPPSAPSGLNVSNASQTSLTLGWNESTDNVGAVGYDVYRAGTKMATTPGTSYAFGNLTCGTSYVLGVAAYDAAGNRSATVTASGSTSACSAPPPGSWPTSYYGGPAGASIILPPGQGVFVGAASGAKSTTTDPTLGVLDQMSGRVMDLEHRFIQNRCTLDYQTGDGDSVAKTVERGHIPLLSWSPSITNGGRILAGEADACIVALGRAIAGQPHKVLLRIYWEFNGTWMPWSKDADGSLLTTTEFKTLWLRTINKLREGGAFPKASVVWCPAAGYYNRPNASLDAKASYPGDAYVDWVCADGYNNLGDGVWREFKDLFHLPQNVEADFRGRKPFLVGETGTKEDGADSTRKANWFRNARNYIETSMPGLVGLAYFDVAYSDGDWRIGTSDASRQGWRDLVSDTYFNLRT